MIYNLWIYDDKGMGYMVKKNVKSRVWIHFGIFSYNEKGYIKYGYGNKGLWLGNT
jgi:hypothetical protein